jgi:large subunit ribosomal protein L5
MSAEAPARLKVRYMEEIRPQLVERFGYSSSMQTPHLEKVTLNMGVGDAKQDSKALKAAQDQLATIAGQQPSVRRARKSIAAFKLREGMPVGVSVTLRRERCYEFLDRLISIAIPRIRDFRGLRARSFDGRGNYSMGVREQIIFPEIDYDAIDQVRGLDITITTSARSDVEAFALLSALGMPFSTYGRPAEFAQVLGESADTSADSETEIVAQESANQEAPVGEDAETAPDSGTEIVAQEDADQEAPVGEGADTAVDSGTETVAREDADQQAPAGESTDTAEQEETT